MTGNVVLMGFRLGGASRISLTRSVIALFCFMLGAVAGGSLPKLQRSTSAPGGGEGAVQRV